MSDKLDYTCEHHNERVAHHSEEVKKGIGKRLNKIIGQVRGIAKMVEQDIYCDHVLNQITSAQAALDGVRMLLLELHIKSCVLDQIKEGKTEVIGELMKTIGRML
jgi:DNA-binding FrmR family transcriptional regulator